MKVKELRDILNTLDEELDVIILSELHKFEAIYDVKEWIVNNSRMGMPNTSQIVISTSDEHSF